MDNFVKEYEQQLNNIRSLGIRPRLLLHTCCAPCLSGMIEELHSYFDITLYFSNPNISPGDEYEYRLAELSKLLDMLGFDDVKIASPKYMPEAFFDIAKGLEEEKEGGKRCEKCYRLRLEDSFLYAKENNFDFVTTTLSVSPYKNAGLLNEIGILLEREYGIKYLISDFKKNNGYKRSCENSKKFGLYRQDYCGCIYSKLEADNRIRIKEYDYLPEEAKKIREEVFIKEQGFLSEYDDIDNRAIHLLAFNKKEYFGTLRLFTKEDDDKTYILGRLAVKKDARGKKIGSMLVNYAVKYVKNKGGKKLILHSQLHATEFYKKLGFIEFGEIEYEEDCPHIWMEKR